MEELKRGSKEWYLQGGDTFDGDILGNVFKKAMEELKPYTLCKQCALRRKECMDKDDVKWLVGCYMFLDKKKEQQRLKREVLKNENTAIKI